MQKTLCSLLNCTVVALRIQSREMLKFKVAFTLPPSVCALQ